MCLPTCMQNRIDSSCTLHNGQNNYEFKHVTCHVQVVHDVDQQKVPVRFVITSAGLVGSDGPLQCGAFDITFMSCLPNMIVMAPSDEAELVHMVATAVRINDQPVCFRYPRGALVGKDEAMHDGIPIEVIEQHCFLDKL